MQYQFPGKYYGINRDFADTRFVRFPGISDLLTHPACWCRHPSREGIFALPSHLSYSAGKGIWRKVPSCQEGIQKCVLLE
jgi:hypothetical protein